MGRRKKKSNNLKNLGIGTLVGILGVYGYVTFMDTNPTLPIIDWFNSFKNHSRIEQPVVPEEISETLDNSNNELSKVKIYFIEHKNGKDIYRPVYRKNNSGRSDIEYAVKSLLEGPTKYEREKGVYSEIPKSLLLSVNETDKEVTINISDTFANGGGADSLYKRMYQLIKTVNYNTEKPVYLLINGQKAETLGGEGLMISQPLNGSSLDG